jgi:hypothetical protein
MPGGLGLAISNYVSRLFGLEQRADQNELDCLEEVVQEHERDRRDNTKTIREQISCIEGRPNRTQEAERLLERARRAIELNEKVEKDLEVLKARRKLVGNE